MAVMKRKMLISLLGILCVGGVIFIWEYRQNLPDAVPPLAHLGQPMTAAQAGGLTIKAKGDPESVNGLVYPDAIDLAKNVQDTPGLRWRKKPMGSRRVKMMVNTRMAKRGVTARSPSAPKGGK